ncbi:MAG: hypothetical protein PHV34_09020 [Verrucomicrobiae bacterium]|nr:hypothetical protein [Verrucomicrobiae bacterium]
MSKLPLAALDNLFGLIFFAIIAFISFLSKRAQEKSEEENQPPSAGRRPQQSPGEPESLDDWLRELTQTPPPPKPAAPPPPVRQTPPVHRHQMPSQQHKTPQYSPKRPAKPSKPPVVAPSPVRQTEAQHVSLAGPPQDIYAELHASNARLAQEMSILKQLRPTPAAEITNTQSEVRCVEGGLLRAPGALRQGIILAEVLGKPRSLAPLNRF